jgi:ABC-type glycerol-3-phosphate transport system permease component
MGAGLLGAHDLVPDHWVPPRGPRSSRPSRSTGPTWSLDAWNLLVSDWPIAKYLRNSLVAVAGSVVLDLILAIPAAYALSRYEFRGREDIGFYILSTRMMAPGDRGRADLLFVP